MKEVKIKTTFDAYPKGHRETFTAGDTVSVPNDFAKLIVEQGHATYVDKSDADEEEDEKTTARTTKADAEEE